MTFQEWCLAEEGRLLWLARQMKLTKGSPWQWSQTRVPAEQMFRVSELTGLRLSEIRPDLVKRNAKLHV